LIMYGLLGRLRRELGGEMRGCGAWL